MVFTAPEEVIVLVVVSVSMLVIVTPLGKPGQFTKLGTLFAEYTYSTSDRTGELWRFVCKGWLS